jgi:hypothetical protein
LIQYKIKMMKVKEKNTMYISKGSMQEVHSKKAIYRGREMALAHPYEASQYSARILRMSEYFIVVGIVAALHCTSVLYRADAARYESVTEDGSHNNTFACSVALALHQLHNILTPYPALSRNIQTIKAGIT